MKKRRNIKNLIFDFGKVLVNILYTIKIAHFLSIL